MSKYCIGNMMIILTTSDSNIDWLNLHTEYRNELKRQFKKLPCFKNAARLTPICTMQYVPTRQQVTMIQHVTTIQQ
uniref:Uncharacterized protein n=1 Tax=Onchocerca volvulus TaxID=6282 RepID=A0A8R1TL43_ONCVO